MKAVACRVEDCRIDNNWWRWTSWGEEQCWGDLISGLGSVRGWWPPWYIHGTHQQWETGLWRRPDTLHHEELCHTHQWIMGDHSPPAGEEELPHELGETWWQSDVAGGLDQQEHHGDTLWCWRLSAWLHSQIPDQRRVSDRRGWDGADHRRILHHDHSLQVWCQWLETWHRGAGDWEILPWVCQVSWHQLGRNGEKKKYRTSKTISVQANIVCGGYGEDKEYLDSCEMNLENMNLWYPINPLPMKLKGLAGVNLDGRVLMIGNVRGRCRRNIQIRLEYLLKYF